MYIWRCMTVYIWARVNTCIHKCKCMDIYLYMCRCVRSRWICFYKSRWKYYKYVRMKNAYSLTICADIARQTLILAILILVGSFLTYLTLCSILCIWIVTWMYKAVISSYLSSYLSMWNSIGKMCSTLSFSFSFFLIHKPIFLSNTLPHVA